MQGSVVLPQRLSQQSLAVVQSAKSLTPELVGLRPLETHCSCKLVGSIGRQELPSGSIGFARGAGAVNEFSLSSSIRDRGPHSTEDTRNRRMNGSSFGSFPSPSRSLYTSVFHRYVGIQGKTLDYTWKNLSGAPGPFRQNPVQLLYWTPFRALETSHYGLIAGKKAGQDLLVRDSKSFFGKSNFYRNRSEKEIISALSSKEGGIADVGEKVTTEADTGFQEDSDSESEDDQKSLKEQKQETRLRNMQEEEEDSDSDSDDEDENHKTKKCMTKGKVEVVGMSQDDSDSESDSDEQKEIKKKMKADEKKLKKQAKKEKKEMKALEKMQCDDSSSEDEDKKKIKVKKAKPEEKEALEEMECEDSTSEDEDKKKMKKIKMKTMAATAYSDEELNEQNEYLADSSSGNEFEGQEDDVVQVLPTAIVEEEYEEEDYELVGEEDLSDEIEGEVEDAFEELEDEELDDEFWEDEEGEAMVGDGGDGGGVVLGDLKWEKEALELAEVVVKELGTDFAIYAFKASLDGLVRVRLDKLSDQYGSPTMTDLESFTTKYTALLYSSKLTPDNVAVEISSPGAERMVKLPDELERFKQLPMYVQYSEDESGNVEKDGVLELDSMDSQAGMTVWKLANVKLNREQSGKGRPLNSKQRKWRAHVPFNSLKVIRLYLDV